jgi:acetyl esterase/lipase
MAVFGTSAGGALTLALIVRAKQEGLALPAGIAPGTPMSDVTKTGDTRMNCSTTCWFRGTAFAMPQRGFMPMDMISAIRCSRQFTET